MSPARRVEVDPERIVRWVEGFAARHGAPTWRDDDGLCLSAPDGVVARLVRLGPPAASFPRDASSLAAWAQPPTWLGLLLLRRGGYAVGAADGPQLCAHTCGTRYVQSRTAAGGWSQQRFARRRGNQADALVAAVVERALRLVVPAAPEVLVVGGDRRLVASVLADRRLAALGALPRRELFDLPDPGLAVLRQALRRARAVQVTLTSDGDRLR